MILRYPKVPIFGSLSLSVLRSDALNASIFSLSSSKYSSVLAKVYRDRLMMQLAEKYPGYGIEKHKGYPTPDHKLAVYELGASPIHRRSFLSFLERDREKLEAALLKKRAKESGTI